MLALEDIFSAENNQIFLCLSITIISSSLQTRRLSKKIRKMVLASQSEGNNSEIPIIEENTKQKNLQFFSSFFYNDSEFHLSLVFHVLPNLIIHFSSDPTVFRKFWNTNHKKNRKPWNLELLSTFLISSSPQTQKFSNTIHKKNTKQKNFQFFSSFLLIIPSFTYAHSLPQKNEKNFPGQLTSLV